MSDNILSERQLPSHAYLNGNFAPIRKALGLTPCSYEGVIPSEFIGGQYVRNGGNPLHDGTDQEDAHWFDGDGMLTGVLFRRDKQSNVVPEFVNQYILTDTFLSASSMPTLKRPVRLSVATLANPATTIFSFFAVIFRYFCFVILSYLPGSQYSIRRISVANTAILFHDQKALATCESGPPMQIMLPALETVGWLDQLSEKGPLGWMKEWTTAHPRVDPTTGELIAYHSTFLPPYVRYSIIPSRGKPPILKQAPVPGMTGAKMMHDFGVSLQHTVIMDLPLSLAPLNLLTGRPVVSYDTDQDSRFGVFPRYRPDLIRWYHTEPCYIFHVANTWDHSNGDVSLLGCRLTVPTLLYSAGNIQTPQPKGKFTWSKEEEDQCRLYFYQFSGTSSKILHQFALSAIPFEFPTLNNARRMSEARYIYGCTGREGSYGTALGKNLKIGVLAKIDCISLISSGIENPPPGGLRGCVDRRTVREILGDKTKQQEGPVQLFALPDGYYAQEASFISREHPVSEDDGWLVSYVFDENQLGPDGSATPDAQSELWIIDAKDMDKVVARVKLPQRVPYGFHGTWFSEEDISSQEPALHMRASPKFADQSIFRRYLESIIAYL